MLKRLFLIALLTFHFSLFTFSQTWEPVGGGATRWDTNYLKHYHYALATLCVYHDRLYAGGSMTQVGNIRPNCIACWDGKKWSTVSGGVNDYINCLCVYNNMLCAGGCFTKAGQKNCNGIVLWSDTSKGGNGWNNLDSGIPRYRRTIELENSKFIKYVADNTVDYVLPYKGFLYATGQFIIAGNLKVHSIARWDGTKWCNAEEPKNAMKPFMGDDAGNVASKPMAVYKDTLYVSDWISPTGDDALYLWKCDGENAIATPNPWLWPKDATAQECMIGTDNYLYVGGANPSWEKKPRDAMAEWDGKAWHKFGKCKTNQTIYALLMYQNKLYIGGSFDTIDGVCANGIACWDGKTMQPVGEGFNINHKNFRTVHALCVYKGELYAAGYFTNSGDKTVLNIAKLNLGNNKPTQPKKKK